MKKAPYTPSPKNIKEFFKKIQSLGVPPKVDVAYLATIGFKSSNDRYLTGVAKSLGFADTTGRPTDKWKDFRDTAKAPKVMADAIKIAYADLFDTYPDAEKSDDQTLQNYFAPKFEAAASVAKYMVQTFKNLCEFADFEAVVVAEAGAKPTTPPVRKGGEVPPGVKPVTININIQLSLPATEDASIYDKLFEALKKHLFP